MMKTLIAVSAVAATVGSVATPAQATGRPAAAFASCYGSATYFGRLSGAYVPDGGANYFRTTTSCSDINIRTFEGGSVVVCFRATGACQRDYTALVPGQWTVVATNVRDNSEFQFLFSSAGVHSGYWAA